MFYGYLPVTHLRLAQEPIVGITAWRICGPFPVSLKDNLDSETGENDALKHDFLADANGGETTIRFPFHTTHWNIVWARDEAAEADSPPTQPHFLNQVISFPSPDVSTQLLYWGSFHIFKVMYAAADIVANRDEDLVLLAPTNSPIKILINGQTVLSAAAGSDANAHLGTNIHLHRGDNTILVKMFCFPLRNNFHVWLATITAANRFLENQGGLIQPVEHLVINHFSPLRLTALAILRYSQFMSPTSSTYEIIKPLER